MISQKQKPNKGQLKAQQTKDVLSITMPMIHRMTVEGKSKQTIKSYVRAVERLVRFHDSRDMDIDEVLDFLVSLNDHQRVNWRTQLKFPPDIAANHKAIKNKLYKTDWVVYAKKPLGDLIRYWNIWVDTRTKSVFLIIEF